MRSMLTLASCCFVPIIRNSVLSSFNKSLCPQIFISHTYIQYIYICILSKYTMYNYVRENGHSRLLYVSAENQKATRADASARRLRGSKRLHAGYEGPRPQVYILQSNSWDSVYIQQNTSDHSLTVLENDCNHEVILTFYTIRLVFCLARLHGDINLIEFIIVILLNHQ